MTGRQDYARFQQELVEKYRSVGCQVSSDCSIYYAKNSCASSCGFVVPTQQLVNLDSNLSTFAQQHCAAECPPLPTPPCEPSPAPQCIAGFCQ
jgi:hypothetical protein